MSTIATNPKMLGRQVRPSLTKLVIGRGYVRLPGAGRWASPMPISIASHASTGRSTVRAHSQLAPQSQQGPPSPVTEKKFMEELRQCTADGDMEMFIKLLKERVQAPYTSSPRHRLVTNRILDIMALMSKHYRISDGSIDWAWCLAQLGFTTISVQRKVITRSAVSRLCNTEGLTAKDVRSCLYNLGQTGARFAVLTPFLRKALLRTIHSAAEGVGLNRINSILLPLGEIECSFLELSVAEQEAIWAVIEESLPHLEVPHFSRLLVALGNFGVEFDKISHKQRNDVIAWARKGLSPKAYSAGTTILVDTSKVNYNTLLGLGMMKMPLKRFPKDLMKMLVTFVDKTMPGMDGKEVGALLHIIASMESNWKEITDLRYVVERNLTTKLPLMNLEEMADVLNVMRQLNITVHLIYTHDARETLHVAVADLLCPTNKWQKDPASTAKHVVSIVSDYAAMSVLWHHKEFSAKRSIPSAFIALSRDMNKEQRTTYLDAMLLLETNTEHLSGDFCYAVAQDAVDMASVWKVLEYLLKFEAAWRDLPSSFHDLLLTVLAEPMKYPTSTVVHVVCAMGSLRAPWSEINSDVRAVLNEYWQTSDLPPHEKIEALTGLSRMGVVHSEIPFQPFESIFGCTDVAPFVMAECLYGLGSMDVKWNDLPIQSCRDIAQFVHTNCCELTSRNFSNILYSLAQCSFDCDFQTYAKNRSSMSDEEQERVECLISICFAALKGYNRWELAKKEQCTLQNFAIFFEMWKAIQGKRAPLFPELPVLPTVKGKFNKPSSVSNFVQTLLTSFSETYHHALRHPVRFRRKFDGFNGVNSLVMDFAVMQQEKVIAFLELHGPKNYAPNGELKRIGRLKEFIYSHGYPNRPIHRLILDTEGLDAAAVGAEFALQVVHDQKRALEAMDHGRWDDFYET